MYKNTEKKGVEDMTEYNGSSIEVLEGLEPVRKRPGMYIGSTGSRGLHHLIWEILDNAIDEHLAGYCTEIDLILNQDGSVTIKDNGRGIPVDKHPIKGITTERVVFTILHAGGKFNNTTYKVSGGLHGVGASVVNALSKRLEVEIYRNGKVYRDLYINGGHSQVELVDGELLPIGECDINYTGTKITFLPDDEIFETVEFKPEIIKKRLKEIAFLNKNLVIHYKDLIRNEYIDFKEEKGIIGFVEYINKNYSKIHDNVIYLNGKSSGIEVEVAFQYTTEFTEQIISFCNNISTIEGGTHVSGFKTALTRVMNQYARELGILKEKDENFDGKDIRNGLTAIISIKHPDPQYEGQTKTKLGNSDVKGVIDDIVSIEIQKYFDRNVEELKTILDNAMKSYKVRKAEEKAKNTILSKTTLLEINSKLASCISKNSEETELILVEGDSAGGSAKQARDRRIQAILPLKGKVLNVEKNGLSKVLANKEIVSIINALGCGIGDDFDINKLKYSKIIIMTDADVDGSHIRTLLLTFFYRYMPELILEGKVYKAIPPLYKVTYEEKGRKKAQFKYLYSDHELEKLKKSVNIISIQRYKGLGEMNPEQLWETTLNPTTRLLAQITIEDAVEADEITNVLMGNQVQPRREFIQEEAHNAELLI